MASSGQGELGVKNITPPQNLKWCTAKDLYYCKLVAEFTKGGKYAKRAVVLTLDKLFVCDPSGAVIRVISCRDVAKVTTQEIEVSKKMGLSKELETHLLLNVPNEPDLVLNIPREPLEFIKVLRELNRYAGTQLATEHLHKDDLKLTGLVNFVPPPGYVDTHTRIKHMNQASRTQGGLSASQAITKTTKKFKPVTITTETGMTVSLVLTENGQLEWWEDEVLMATGLRKLSLTGNVLESHDCEVSCCIQQCEGGGVAIDVLRGVGMLAAYSRTETTGLPVPSRRRVEGKYDIAPKTVTMITREGETLKLSQGTVSYLVSADFGTAESYENVMDVVASMVAEGGLEVLVRSDILGTDPAPGMMKCLTLCYGPVTTPIIEKVVVERPADTESVSSRSKGSSYRHDPYKASNADSDGEIEVVGSTASASSFSSYAYSQASSLPATPSYQQPYPSTIPFQTFIHANLEDPYDLSSPPLASSSESTSGIPPLMQTFDSEGSLSRRSSLSHPVGYSVGQSSTAVDHKHHASGGSSLHNSDAPPTLLSDSAGHHDPNSDPKGQTPSEFTTISAARPAQTQLPQQWMQPLHPGYPQQLMHQQVQQQAMQQHILQQQAPPRGNDRSRGGGAKPVSKGFVEFTDTDGDLVRFKDVGGVIELSVNQNILGYLRSLDYDAKSGQLNDGIGGCTLPVARRKGLESRLAWLAEMSGVAHNIKADGPMLFEITLGHVGEPLGLSFEVLADGTVRISDVVASSPCGKAGVVCGVMQTLDGQMVHSGDDLRRIVTAIRENGRTAFQLEVKKRPKEDARRNDTEQQAPIQSHAPPGGGKGKKGGKGKNSRQSDALVRLFVLFKHGRRAEYASNERVPLGAHVLVESREGVDLGLVAGARLGGRKDDRYRVQRIAQPSEVAAWKALVTDEEQALQVAIQNALAVGIALSLHKCEIQYDRRKITFHYTGTPPREHLASFTQTCTSVFGCRISFNNCQPPAGEKGDPIDLSTPAIPVL